MQCEFCFQGKQADVNLLLSIEMNTRFNENGFLEGILLKNKATLFTASKNRRAFCEA